jgi:hypothetical protein
MTPRPCSKRSRRRYLLPVLERVRGWGRGGLANVASLSYTPCDRVRGPGRACALAVGVSHRALHNTCVCSIFLGFV